MPALRPDLLVGGAQGRRDAAERELNYFGAMEFCDLKAQYRRYQPELDAAMRGVLETSAFVGGPEVRALEDELSAFCGARHAIACANGSDALLGALLALGVQPGDEIIVPDFTFFATAEMVALAGAVPVFADIDPESFNIDPADVRRKIGPRTVGILPVSLFGRCADIPALELLAREHGLWVLEDAAQSFGAMLDGRRSCSLTTIATTSFFPAKPLGCYGDGGAVFAGDDDLAARLRLVLNHGQSRRYHHDIIGMNSRLDGIQAAVLRVKLRHFAQELAERDRIAGWYTERLHGTVATPVVGPGRVSAWAQYTVRVPGRDRVQDLLQAGGIPTAVHYPIPLHAQRAFQHLGVPDDSCPNALAASREVLSLPMHAFLSESDVDRICSALAAALATAG